jgi:large subunit ribosomal protein L25
MVAGMSLALLPASTARLGTSMHDRPGDGRVELRLPAQDATGRRADVAAVLTEPDAPDQHLDVVFTEAGVGARGAALCAIKASLDAFEERRGLHGGAPRVCLQHLLCVSHLHLLRARQFRITFPRIGVVNRTTETSTALNPAEGDSCILGGHRVERGRFGCFRLHLRAVAGERMKLEVAERPVRGSAESRRLRRRGVVPGVLYGQNDPIAIAVGERDLRAALTTPAGSHVVLDVVVDGGSAHSAILKDFQRDKVRGTIMHIDLQEVRLDQPIQTAVVVRLVGDPVGVKEGGVLSQVANEVNVEALPLEVPQQIDVDVSEMRIGDSLRLAEVEVPEGVRFLDDPDETVLVNVTLPTRVEEPEVEVEGEEAVEGEAPEAEAEQAAEAEPADDGGETSEG